MPKSPVLLHLAGTGTPLPVTSIEINRDGALVLMHGEPKPHHIPPNSTGAKKKKKPGRKSNKERAAAADDTISFESEV